ncbi:MAG: hypothetical protein HY363_04130 [Candidatus Aenigmarchaeota archaeon]|nr:hypothetical protein [Candidatus Aenigmarchaeota archaeon]
MEEQHIRTFSITLLGLVAVVALVGIMLLFSGKLTPSGAQVLQPEQFCKVHTDCPEGNICQKFTTYPHAVMGKCLPLT